MKNFVTIISSLFGQACQETFILVGTDFVKEGIARAGVHAAQ